MAWKYSTTQGDCWDLISYKVYGEEGYIDALINANPSLRHTVIFGADTMLVIPDKPALSPAALLPPWRK